MAVGLGQDTGTINTWAYNISLGLEQAFQRANELKVFLDATSDATLEAAPYNYSATEVAQLKSAINDAVTLGNIYTGAQAQGATVYDFRTFLKLMRGASCW